MPISYAQQSTYNLLQIEEIYQLIDNVCKLKYSDWNIDSFEKLLLGENIDLSYGETGVREAVKNDLLNYDESKPFLCYLEEGKHYGNELFKNVPIPNHYQASFERFWLYVSRAFSKYVLPIDEEHFRKMYLEVTEHFGIKINTNRDYNISSLVVKNGYGNDGYINAKDVRQAMYIVEARNRAFKKRVPYSYEQCFLDLPRKIFEERAGNYNNYFWQMRLKDSFDIHSLCFAIDSSSTERQRDVTFTKWGIFSGASLTYAECGRQFGISGNCVRQFENAVIRNAIRDKSMLFELVPKD